MKYEMFPGELIICSIHMLNELATRQEILKSMVYIFQLAEETSDRCYAITGTAVRFSYLGPSEIPAKATVIKQLEDPYDKNCCVPLKNITPGLEKLLRETVLVYRSLSLV